VFVWKMYIEILYSMFNIETLILIQRMQYIANAKEKPYFVYIEIFILNTQ
jgi:hypothetical protein